MSIKETEVLVSLTGVNVKYYENIGYVIPRRIAKNGRLSVEKGTKILIRIEDLKEGSDVVVTKICDEIGCGNVSKLQYGVIVKLREKGDGKDRCADCGRKKIGEDRRNNVKYSLERWVKENDKEYLLDEFSSKNSKLPNQVSKGTDDKYWWNCPKCDSEYDMSVYDRTYDGNNCPFCKGRRTNLSNCLSTTHPEIAKALRYQERADNLTWGSGKKEEFICLDCGYVNKRVVRQIVNQGYYSCKRCGDSVSFPEKFMFAFLSELKIDFEIQKTFEWSKNAKHENPKLSGTKKYDFYIPSKNLIIETHGIQHYEESFGNLGRTLSEEQENDELKKTLAYNNKISNYIEIDCSKSSVEYVRNSILNSTLVELFDLFDINWMKCNEFATSNLVKKACNLWNNGIKSALEITNLMKLNTATVRRYLKQGADIDWCDYNAKSFYNNLNYNRKAVIQLSLDGEFIKEWQSATDAGKELSIDCGNIPTVCNGKRNSAGGFRWIHKEDYEKQLLQTS